MTLGDRHIWTKPRPDQAAECLRCGARVHWPISRDVCPTPSFVYVPLGGIPRRVLTDAEVRDELRRYG